MPDLEAALETIDMYVEKCISKPEKNMSKSDLRLWSQRMNAIDILKEHLRIHWFEAKPSDLIYNFINEYKRRSYVMGGDPMNMVIYKVAKEILYYFI